MHSLLVLQQGSYLLWASLQARGESGLGRSWGKVVWLGEAGPDMSTVSSSSPDRETGEQELGGDSLWLESQPTELHFWEDGGSPNNSQSLVNVNTG